MDIPPVLRIIDPLTFSDWNKLLLSQRVQSIFHTSNWAKVLHDTYEYRPCYFTNIENGTLRTLIPLMEIDSMITGKRGVSLPFSDYCELIIDEDLNIRDALNELIEHGRKSGWRSIELMDGTCLPKDAVSSASYYEHTLDLSRGGQEISSSFSENTRRNIKKAIQNNIEVVVGKSVKSVEEFYRLHCMTRRRHGLPPQPLRFFKSIYNNIILNDLGQIMLAQHNGVVIAAAIYYHFGAKAIFKYGASDSRYKMLRANNLLMWRAIELLVQRGCRELSLGRTDLADEGLRRFKKGWGTDERIVKYYKYDLKKAAFVGKRPQVFGYQKMLFRIMPSFLLRMAGSLMYKHIG